MTRRRIGPYEVLTLLGAGGMGEVYRARDTALGRDVAIKILPSSFSLDPDRNARFEREARVLASLNHPNIAAIYGIETSDGIRALPPGGFHSEAEIAAVPGVRVINYADVSPGVHDGTYAFSAGAFQRNLYRIPIP